MQQTGPNNKHTARQTFRGTTNKATKKPWVPPCYFYLNGHCQKMDCRFDHDLKVPPRDPSSSPEHQTPLQAAFSARDLSHSGSTNDGTQASRSDAAPSSDEDGYVVVDPDAAVVEHKLPRPLERSNGSSDKEKHSDDTASTYESPEELDTDEHYSDAWQSFCHETTAGALEAREESDRETAQGPTSEHEHGYGHESEHERENGVLAGRRDGYAGKSPPACHFYFKGRCLNGDSCAFAHVPALNKPVVATNPDSVTIVERQRQMIEDATARGRPPCSACNLLPREYALMSCEHCFCLHCATTWRELTRSSSSLERLACGYCPHCGPAASFVIPSTHFYPPGPQKDAVFASYHRYTKRTPCKHVAARLRRGYAWCPFGSMCIFGHKHPVTGEEIHFKHTLNDTLNSKRKKRLRRQAVPLAQGTYGTQLPASVPTHPQIPTISPSPDLATGDWGHNSQTFQASQTPLDRSAIHPSVSLLLWPPADERPSLAAAVLAQSALATTPDYNAVRFEPTESGASKKKNQKVGFRSLMGLVERSTLRHTHTAVNQQKAKAAGANGRRGLSKSLPADKA